LGHLPGTWGHLRDFTLWYFGGEDAETVPQVQTDAGAGQKTGLGKKKPWQATDKISDKFF
jgi:hypothetical protein